jgi:uncharacterized protein (TIGR01777 family)
VEKRQKILVSGSSGLIGAALCAYLRTQGETVVRLVRSKSKVSSDTVFWNPTTEEIYLDQLENFDVVIHLAGDNLMSGRWTKRKKESIFRSRCRDTWLLSQALCRLSRPPKFFFSASAIGFYGDRGDEILTEESSPGSGFLSEVCIEWEAATEAASKRGIRVAEGRFGVVLSPKGGMLKKMLPLARKGLGVKFGSGKQYISWICLDDLIRAIDYIRLKAELYGPFNFTSFYPVSNAEFVDQLARHLHRPSFLRFPASVVKFLWGTMASNLLLASTRVIPKKLIQAGFTFSTPTLSETFSHLI